MDTVPINAMSEIIPPIDGKGGLYLGNIVAAKHLHHLIKFNIKALLTLIDGSKYFKHPKEIVFHKLHLGLTPNIDGG